MNDREKYNKNLKRIENALEYFDSLKSADNISPINKRVFFDLVRENEEILNRIPHTEHQILNGFRLN